MTSGRQIFVALLLAIVLGALAALPFGADERRLSVELWLLAAGMWFGLATATALFRAAPLATTPLRGFFGLPSPPPESVAKIPRDLQALEGTVIGGRDSVRGYRNRLRPRLLPIVSHGLLASHGIDLEREPARAAAVLGDLAWIIDPTVDDRHPSLTELDELLDMVTNQPSTSTATGTATSTDRSTVEP